jgi:APA family basic amino acid/polyamine antiporter
VVVILVLAALAVVAFTVLNLRGVTRTAAAAKVLLVATVVVLAGFLALAATATVLATTARGGPRV